MKIRAAHATDISALAQLEQTYQQDELSQNQATKLQGQSFNHNDLARLIEKEYLWVAEVESHIVAYVIAGSWAFFEHGPIYQMLLRRIQHMELESITLTKDNTCQYGPIWIHPSYRGKGLFNNLVNQIKQQVVKKYPYMITFISDENERSFAAHTQKAAMQVIDFFTFEDRDYYLLLSHTRDEA
ncbi:GNAT family N-acetyltransferase [uncultured Shewanella sp.]|uniref:GNAT family N-acetyltransferase n=1 Tax=uncultured Shewanella sp. TaxID=173975 RepID=UPI00262DD183|nr:GNAT family N-acetyltransferase [uncultured Shewanella sp.]